MRFFRLAAKLAALFSFGLTMSAQAAAGRMDETAFTKDIAKRFATVLPEAGVTVVEDLSLNLSMPDFDGEVSLQRVWDFCRHNTGGCDEFVADYIAQMSEAIRKEGQAMAENSIRAVIRSKDYLQSAGDTAKDFIEAELTPNLSVILVVDRETSTRTLMRGDLPKMRLTKEEAFAAAKRNLEEALPPLGAVVKTQMNGAFGAVAGDDYYAASRVLLHEQWRMLAKTINGSLLVTIPDGGVAFYADSSNPAAVNTLIRITAYNAQKSDRPISTQILAWTEKGWIEWGEPSR